MKLNMRILLIGLLALNLNSCGKEKGDDKTEIIVKDGLANNQSQPNPKTDAQPPETDSTNSEPTPMEVSSLDLNQLAATYEQVENRQAKLRIDTNFLVVTNISLPIPSGSGSVRLTPKFPHHLVKEDGKETFTTKGFYNDGNNLFDNVELRILPYNQGQFLDVTFVLPPSTNPQSGGPFNGSEGTDMGDYQSGNDGGFNGNGFGYPCGDPCCDPCFPPPPPPPPCDPCCCDNTPEEGRSLLYRFERVEAPSGQQLP